ncbi:hypothetical protein [Pseudactinotalea sp. HY158]|uniref:hypothetical protein n=1 Tax=Pseudactinotalea sp. HY158 TaxID=2654547 RepID=UPI00129C275E|nr:hypothetical protein [Pseudactinotalea sp. HY158]QGH70603.1 hypothetical protein GCE65_14725 [Pseudactinotalea sp. HY158]
MSSPFDDPEVQAAMAKAGVVHRPGLAAETLAELAPLLAAEGVDLEDPDTDLEALNAALERATERHNLELFTPVGTPQEQVGALLVEFAQVVTHKRPRAAEAILGAIGPDPAPGRPAAAHVIGASLGLLDAWHTSPEFEALRQVPVPKWRGPARSTAAHLIEAARRGGAYDSLRELIARHGGEFVMHASVLAAAATILASAESAGEDVPTAGERLLRLAWGASRTSPSGRAVGDDAAWQAGRSDLSRRFVAWLEAEELDDIDDAEWVEALEEFTAAAGLDLENPGHMPRLIEAMRETEDEEHGDFLLAVLHDYVHFQAATGTAEAAWGEACALIDEETGEDDPRLEILVGVIERATAADPEARRAAVGRLRIVAGVSDLLAWLARPRPITGTGGLRRVDIAPVAAMIGIDAVGVTKRPAPEGQLDLNLEEPEPAPATLQVQSIKDLPVLDTWWRTLEFMEYIELTATRVRPGAGPGIVEADGSMPSDAETFVAVFFANLLMRAAEESKFGFGLPILLMLMDRITAAVAPGEYSGIARQGELVDLLGPLAGSVLGQLAEVGLIELDEEGVATVPEPLRGVVASGLLAAMAAVLGDDDPDA